MIVEAGSNRPSQVTCWPSFFSNFDGHGLCSLSCMGLGTLLLQINANFTEPQFEITFSIPNPLSLPSQVSLPHAHFILMNEN